MYEIQAMFDSIAEELESRGDEALASMIDELHELFAYSHNNLEGDVEIMTGRSFRVGLCKLDNLGGGKISVKQKATAGIMQLPDADKYLPRGRTEGQIVDAKPSSSGKQHIEVQPFHKGAKPSKRGKGL